MIDYLKRFESDFGPQAELIKEQALEVTAVARERLAEGRQRVRDFIVDKPTQALAIALGMGVVLGWLIKRR